MEEDWGASSDAQPVAQLNTPEASNSFKQTDPRKTRPGVTSLTVGEEPLTGKREEEKVETRRGKREETGDGRITNCIIACSMKRMEKVGSEPKKRKLNPPPRRKLSSTHSNVESAGKSTTQSSTGSSSGMKMKIEEAKRFAVVQAQHDGCTGNYRIFDSPYGNFLVPVIPNRADLGG